ncbi:SAM-dependent methyltransferase [Oxalicibacterium flavum]|uniref:SAM-dependent methyltransferase n=1 Tax=Oxalicibacterium flavum TaxID=179467 RepID=A0A8J2UM21_9BURK|nr:class I SAM-dependent methyltransferase [Oxalicibacterium flavum]GGC16126.1 SAM-dependent methyltransferase [Oxalicibacterium flavum]
MTQNIYDDASFFEAYSGLERSLKGLDGAPEWPALRARIQDLRGARVLDLGCGFGWFCRWAAEQGADTVLGLDVSENMLTRARASTTDRRIAYRHADLEHVRLGRSGFDLVYSSLVLHYLENLPRLFGEIHGALEEGGDFLFSVEHPLVTAPDRQGWEERHGGPVWPVNDYLQEGARTTDWLAPGVVKQHRTIAGYLNPLLAAGFALVHLDEWGPDTQQVAQRPEWERERHRPPFLLVHARRIG